MNTPTPDTNPDNTPRTGTIEDKLRRMNARIVALRLEKFERGSPFMIFLKETPELYYNEYGDGRIEVKTLGDKEKTILQTLTGADADQVRISAGIIK